MTCAIGAKFDLNYCEAKGKGRAKGTLREVNQLSFIDYRLSIINVDFPEALH